MPLKKTHIRTDVGNISQETSSQSHHTIWGQNLSILCFWHICERHQCDKTDSYYGVSTSLSQLISLLTFITVFMELYAPIYHEDPNQQNIYGKQCYDCYYCLFSVYDEIYYYSWITFLLLYRNEPRSSCFCRTSFWKISPMSKFS